MRKLGKADLFVTFTCNPRWPEIVAIDAALPNVRGQERDDLIARVFKQKLNALLKDLVEDGRLGEVIGYLLAIEFQKRRLPHGHLLLIFKGEDRLKGPADYDDVICAEMPDPIAFPDLHEAVKSSMVHGPCGALNQESPCMKDGRCTKGYPKPLRDVTEDSEDGYPAYRRRGRFTATMRMKVRGNWEDVVVGDEWVVPYIRNLMVRYNAHINAEYSARIENVKYLHKYIHKGPDRAEIELMLASGGDVDETKVYMDGRYISTMEAVWHAFRFEMHKAKPVVVRLQVHLDGDQFVTFSADDSPQGTMQAAGQRMTTLTAWFKSNEVNPERCDLLYPDYPERYRFDKTWEPRHRVAAVPNIGRMYFVSPRSGDTYYLRVLLCHVPGATSYKDLRTYDGVEYHTFQEACRARGYLQDDAEWDRCLLEATRTQMASSIRYLFGIILVHNQPEDPAQLWRKHCKAMADDFAHRMRRNGGLVDEDAAMQAAVWELETILKGMGSGLAKFPGMPKPIAPDGVGTASVVRQIELNYDKIALLKHLDENLGVCNPEQKGAVDGVRRALDDPLAPRLFSIDSPAGGGKTFVLGLLLAMVRSEGKIAIATASTGIAAVLMQGGTTAHSAFGIPIMLDSSSTSRFSLQEAQAEVLRDAELLIWDEITMAHRDAFNVVDRLLRDIMSSADPLKAEEPFGGKIVVVAGDWRQLLPVIPNAQRAAVVGATVKRSPVWAHFKVVRFTRNMRVEPILQPNMRSDPSQFLGNWFGIRD